MNSITNINSKRKIFSSVPVSILFIFSLKLSDISLDKSDIDKEKWYQNGLSKFKDANWKKEINLFHLNDKSVSSSLLKVAESI